jgi:hypothetical protein
MGLGFKGKIKYGPDFLHFLHKRGKEKYSEKHRKVRAEKRKMRTP